MFTAEFLGSPPQASLSEAANPCLGQRASHKHSPRLPMPLHCHVWGCTVLCKDEWYKHCKGLMKEDRCLLVSRLKGWNANLWRGWVWRSSRMKNMFQPLHTTVMSTSYPTAQFFGTQILLHRRKTATCMCALSRIVFSSRNYFCFKHQPLPPSTLKSSLCTTSFRFSRKTFPGCSI